MRVKAFLHVFTLLRFFMLNEQSIRVVGDSKWIEGAFAPCYSNYSFGLIRPSLQGILGRVLPETVGQIDPAGVLPLDVFPSDLGEVQRVVVVLIDALGWELLSRCLEKSNQASRLVERSVLSKLTSLFPSSTTPHMMRLHFGLTVGQSSIVDWTCYQAPSGHVVCPLLNSLASTSFGAQVKFDTLNQHGLDLSSLVPENCSYEELRRTGAAVFNYCPERIASSTFSKLAFRGSEIRAYSSLEKGLEQLSGCLRMTEAPSYSTFYYPTVDSLSHRVGPYSAETLQAAADVFVHLERFLESLGDLTGTLVAVTADHGQMPIDSMMWLDEELPEVMSLLRSDSTGSPILPCGSPRALFIHVRPGNHERLRNSLAALLESKAVVATVESLVRGGIFGKVDDMERFLLNVGDLIILPKSRVGVFWRGGGLFDENLKGAHGGLSREELHIPLMMFKP